MLTPVPPLQTPLDAIIFDCDGTLSRIEGIDMLASLCDAGSEVRHLTETAMARTGLTPTIYDQRLLLIRPKKQDINKLGRLYIEQLTEDTESVIRVFQSLNKAIYIVSAGLQPAVNAIGEHLGIPATHIHAVNVEFDTAGNYLDFDRTSVLVTNPGKGEIVKSINTRHPRTAFVGDGLNDCAAISLVSRFVGYGGIFPRENIAAQCQFYIRSATTAPLLPLLLTAAESATLAPAAKKLWQKGMDILTTDSDFASSGMIP